MATISFLQSAVDSTDLTTYTFASQNLGAVAADRKIIVCAGGTSATTGITISSITVGGVTATISKQDSNTGSSRVSCVAIATVPTGTTGDVVVTFSAGMGRCGIGLYRTTGLKTTAYATAAAHSDSANTLSNTIDIPAYGVCVATSAIQAAATPTNTWSGITEGFDVSMEVAGNTNQLSGAADLFPQAQSAKTIQTTFAQTGPCSLSIASFEAIRGEFLAFM